MLRKHPVAAEAPNLHKKHNPERYEDTREILKENTEFRWKKRPKKFAGFNQKQLKDLAATTGELVGLRPDQARKVSVIFGDHLQAEYEDGRTHINSAFCIVEPKDDGNTIDKCTVVVNRSLELAQSMAERGSVESETNPTEIPKIDCIFENPWENVIWLLAEELKHAQIELTAGSFARKAKWQKNYEKILHNKDLSITNGYESQIDEIAVSRTALLTLKRFAENRYPDRAAYFDGLYQKSLESSVHVSPNISKLEEDAFQETGYKPKVK